MKTWLVKWQEVTVDGTLDPVVKDFEVVDEWLYGAIERAYSMVGNKAVINSVQLSRQTNETFTPSAHQTTGYVTESHKVTYFVVGPGYWGRGKSVVEAAKNCHKSGMAKSGRVAVQLIIGDDDAKLEGALSISYKQGAVSVFLGANYSLGQLMRVKP